MDGMPVAPPSLALRTLAIAAGLLVATGCTGGGGSSPPSLPSGPPGTTAPTPTHAVRAVSSGNRPSHAPAPPATTVPRPAHIVVVVMENKAYADIIGNPSAPYLNALAAHGALLTRSYAITHPSQPNYVGLFSGSTHGLADDSCPHSFSGPNLAAQLLHARRTFAGYAESLPRAGYTGCSQGQYARKHAPWTDFPALPGSLSQPFSAFPRDYSALPTLAFVIPSLDHDMHNGTIGQGDQWLSHYLSGYARWAPAHDSLLIVTWDEDDGSAGNHIPTIVAGAHVRSGRYAEHVTHYRLLRTLEALDRLPAIGAAAATTPITDIWR